MSRVTEAGASVDVGGGVAGDGRTASAALAALVTPSAFVAVTLHWTGLDLSAGSSVYVAPVAPGIADAFGDFRCAQPGVAARFEPKRRQESCGEPCGCASSTARATAPSTTRRSQRAVG
jgi:hypothetical protein